MRKEMTTRCSRHRHRRRCGGGAAAYGVLAVWFHRRHHLRWTSAVAGLAGAALLLGLLLGVAPAILSRWGLLPA